MTTKENLIEGLADYIDRELVAKIDDRPLRIMIATAVSTIKKNPNAADAVIGHPLVSTMLAKDDSGCYDVRNFSQSLKDSIERHGNLKFDIPPIPMLSSQPITITMDADDVVKIESYIAEV